MKQPKAGRHELSASEVQLLTQLRQQPELMTQLESIVELTRDAQGPLKSADEVEELLIHKLRQLGHTSMNHWATQAEQRVGDELKAQDVTVRSRKKKR